MVIILLFLQSPLFVCYIAFLNILEEKIYWTKKYRGGVYLLRRMFEET